MRGSELLDKLSLVDSAYVEAAAVIPRQPARPDHRWAAVAACIALLAAVGSLWLGQVSTPGQSVPPNGTEGRLPPVTTQDAEDTQNEDAEGPAPQWDFYYNEMDTDSMADAERRYIPGYFRETLDQKELDAVQPGNRISKQGDAGRGIGAVDHQKSNGPQRQQADNLQRTAPQAALFQQPVPQKIYQGRGNVEDSDVSRRVSLPHDAGVGVEQGGDGCEAG